MRNWWGNFVCVFGHRLIWMWDTATDRATLDAYGYGDCISLSVCGWCGREWGKRA